MKRTGKLLVARGIKPSLIVSSELPRAIHSARIIAAEVGYDERLIQYEALFNERVCGVAEGMLNIAIKQRWPAGFDTVPGAETLKQLQKRAAKAVTWLRAIEADIVVVVAHGTFGRAMIREFEGRPHTDEYAAGQLKFDRGKMMRLYPQPTTVLAS